MFTHIRITRYFPGTRLQCKSGYTFTVCSVASLSSFCKYVPTYAMTIGWEVGNASVGLSQQFRSSYKMGSVYIINLLLHMDKVNTTSRRHRKDAKLKFREFFTSVWPQSKDKIGSLPSHVCVQGSWTYNSTHFRSQQYRNGAYVIHLNKKFQMYFLANRIHCFISYLNCRI